MGISPQTEQGIRNEEKEIIAAKIYQTFGEDVPLPSNAENLLNFTKGVNSERKYFLKFADVLRSQKIKSIMSHNRDRK